MRGVPKQIFSIILTIVVREVVQKKYRNGKVNTRIDGKLILGELNWWGIECVGFEWAGIKLVGN